jgi:hypothetical protein
MSIMPGQGQHQILFAYELPYDRKLDLSLKTPLPVDAAIVMIPQEGVRLSSSQLTDAGVRNVQGMSFQMYQATSALAAGDGVSVNLSGRATVSGSVDQEDQLLPVLIAGGIFLLVLADGRLLVPAPAQQPAACPGGWG